MTISARPSPTTVTNFFSISIDDSSVGFNQYDQETIIYWSVSIATSIHTVYQHQQSLFNH